MRCPREVFPFVFCIYVFLLAISLKAQQVDPSAGIQLFSTQAHSVDLATGNVYVNVPVRRKAGKFPFEFDLVANYHAFQIQISGPTGPVPQWDVNPWLIGTPFTLNMGTTFGGTQVGTSCPSKVLDKPYVMDASGAQHSIGLSVLTLCGTTPQAGIATDGSGYTLVRSSSGSIATYDSSGNSWAYYGASTPTLTDPDGTTATINYSTGQYTDSLGVVALTTGSNSYSYIDGSGNTQTYGITTSSYNLTTNFGCSGINELNYGATSLPTSVTTPTGSYVISYEQTPDGNGHTYNSTYTTGRISQITFPSGGSIRYSYSGGNQGVNCASGVVPKQVVTVSDNNGNTSTWTYVNNNTSATPGNFIVVETDPTNNQFVHHFSGEYQTALTAYQGGCPTSVSSACNGGGTVLSTMITCYNAVNSSASGCASPTSVPTLPISQTDVYTSLNTSSYNLIETKFDGYGNTSEIKRYDFGAAFPPSSGPSPLADTTITYDGSSGSCGTLSDSYIYNRPCSVTTVNSGGSQLSQTKYTYNGTGHPTQTQNWVSGSNYLTSSATYNSNGTVATATDANSAVTTPSYSGSGGCNGLLPTSVAYPVIGTAYYTWNCNGGLIATAKDANQQTTTYKYNDPLWRLTEVDNPDGGVSTTTYNTGSSTPWTISTCSTITSSSSCPAGTNSLTGLAKLDGLGRTIEKQITSDPTGVDYTDIAYDKLGRTASVTNPYRTTSDPTYGVTSYVYDAIGRPTTITNPDSSTRLMYYSGAWSNIQDEGNGNGTSRIVKLYQRDGLGRTITVCEVTGVSQQGGGTPQQCSSNDVFGASGFITNYQYDALGNLTYLTQGGQNRTYTYDGLSRITEDANPEAWGPTLYTYDATGQQGDLYQRSAPKPNLASGNGNVTTTYTYDTLHRLTKIKYSDSTTPQSAFTYDESTSWSGATLTNGKGRMTGSFTCPAGASTCGSQNPSSTGEIYSYDPMGRVAWDEQCTTSTCGHSAFYLPYSYDYLGDILTAGNGISGVTFTATYNNTAQLSGLTSSLNDSNHPGTLVQGPQYNALGQVTTDNLGFLNEHYGYTNRGWLYSYWACKVPGSGCSQANMQYTFNMQIWSGGSPVGLGIAPNGDILNGADWINGSWVYSYDDFNRLSTSCEGTCPTSPTQSYTYNYDQYGNRWQQNGSGSGAISALYNFDGNNHITGSTIYYDAAGNETQDGPLSENFHQYGYDGENRLIQVDGTLGQCSTATACYVYDAIGRRSSKTTTSGGEVDYLYDLGGRQVAEISSSGSWNRGEVFAGGRHIATYVGGTTGSTYLNLTDWTGTERMRVNSNQSSTESCTSLPFGDGLSCTGTDESTMHFTGLSFDNEDNLSHAWFRQYTANQARWMHPDPAGLAAVDMTNPQTWNRYAYVTNNPLSLVDPFGLDPCPPGSDSWCIEVVADPVTITAVDHDGSDGPSCAHAPEWARQRCVDGNKVNGNKSFWQRVLKKVDCANKFANNHSLAAAVGAQSSFVGQALGGNTFAGLGSIATAIFGNGDFSAKDAALIAYGGAGQGIPIPGNHPGLNGAGGLLQDTIVKGTTAGVYNAFTGAATAPVSILTGETVAGAATQLSVQTLEDVATGVGAAKAFLDLGVYGYGAFFKCQ